MLQQEIRSPNDPYWQLPDHAKGEDADKISPAFQKTTDREEDEKDKTRRLVARDAQGNEYEIGLSGDLTKHNLIEALSNSASEGADALAEILVREDPEHRSAFRCIAD